MDKIVTWLLPQNEKGTVFLKRYFKRPPTPKGVRYTRDKF